MFKRTETASIVERLYHLLRTGNRGDTIEWTAIENLIGGRRFSGRHQSIIARARRRLLREDGLATIAQPGVGLLIPVANDQVMICSTSRTKRMYRQAGRAIAEVGSAPEAYLSDHARRLKLVSVEHMERTRREIRRLAKKDKG